MEKSRLLTTQEAADRLGVKVTTLAKWRCIGYFRDELRPHKIGRLVKYKEADIEAFIEGCRQ